MMAFNFGTNDKVFKSNIYGMKNYLIQNNLQRENLMRSPYKLVNL